ncbi:MBL fold metallo-hydrolase [candidate division KSB1 bacterium]|nr:MBL fold metallo-hydrolase [candidate division KSB1 bacterium]
MRKMIKSAWKYPASIIENKIRNFYMKRWFCGDDQVVLRILGGRSNCFLVQNHEHYLLVDTARTNRWEQLSKILDSLTRKGGTLDTLVLTHTHFDHAENAAAIKTKYNSNIAVHRSEADYVQKGDSPLPQGTRLLTRLVIRLFAKALQPHFRYKPAEVDIKVDERFDLQALGFNGYLIHTPGHSKGSMSLILNDEIALVGDTLFGRIPGAVFPVYADDPALLIKSWKLLLQTGCKIFLPAHGGAVSRELLKKRYEKQSRRYNKETS